MASCHLCLESHVESRICEHHLPWKGSIMWISIYSHFAVAKTYEEFSDVVGTLRSKSARNADIGKTRNLTFTYWISSVYRLAQ